MAGKDDNRIYHKFRSALECIDPDPYDTWIKGIMGGHSLDPDPGGEAYELVREWSARSAKHEAKAFDYQWNSLKGRPEGQGVGLGTIFYLAKQNGWSYTPPKEDNSESARLEREFEAMPDVSEDSPYFIRKGVSTPSEARQGNGFVAIEVSLWNGDFKGYQKIYDDGHKEFAKGTRLKGGSCYLGKAIVQPEPTICVCEGVATGMSIHQAEFECVNCAFTATNLDLAVKELRTRFPRAPLVICGDDDRHNAMNAGRKYALEAARRYGCKVIFPSFKAWKPDGSTSDFNDLQREEGIDEVKRQIGLAMYPPPEDEHKESQWFSLADCQITDLLTTPPPARRFIISSLIALGIAGVLVAAGGSSKSMLLLQLAISICTGSPWCEGLTASLGEVVDQGAVLFICAEDAREEIHRRLHAIIKPLANDEDQQDIIAKLGQRLHIASTVAKNNLLTEARGSGAVEFTDYVPHIIDIAGRIEDLKLIVIDPLSRFNGGDENDAVDMTRLVEALETLVQGTGATVLAAHHINKAALSSDPSQASSRGSSALVDGVRWMAQLQVMTTQEASKYGLREEDRRCYVRFSVQKSNYAPPVADQWLQRDHHGVLTAIRLQDMKADLVQSLLWKIRQRVEADAAKDLLFCKETFMREYAGKEGPFEVGEKKLKAVVDEAFAKGYIAKARAGDVRDRYPAAAAHKAHVELLIPARSEEERWL